MSALRDYVYFMRNPRTGAVKIGTTKDLHERLWALSLEHGANLELLGYIEGDAAVERALHIHWRQHHMQREWFHPHVDILAYATEKSLPLSDVKPRIRDVAADFPHYAPVLSEIKKIPAARLSESTGCSLRTAENWRSGSTQPSADHLVTLIRDFDEIADAVVTATGRRKEGALTFVQIRKLLEVIGEK